VTSSTRRGVFARLVGLFLQRIWYVHPEVILVVQTTPATCVQTLALNAKPNRHRLQYRNLYAQGRRYHLDPVIDGFRLSTTSRVIWRYKRRTAAAALLVARFTPLGDDSIRLNIQVRVKPLYLLRTFFIPLFMTSILAFVPWNPPLVVAVLILLFSFSWFGHRYNASLEANEMIFFVEKSLVDFVPENMLELGAESSSTIFTTDGFGEAWEKFYEEHQYD
jgi:hypothetical protein